MTKEQMERWLYQSAVLGSGCGIIVGFIFPQVGLGMICAVWLCFYDFKMALKNGMWESP